MAQPASSGSKRPKIKSKKPKGSPAMTRIKTVWITEPSKPFIEDYEVGQQIGEAGQFGKAYRCRRKADKKIFAVKAVSKARFYRLDKSGMQRQALLSAMQGEIDVMRTIKGQNPYIVNLEAVYEDKHMLYIVMEECRGGELFDRIRARGQYNERDAAKVLKMVGDALRFMHVMHQVVHCDLKPDNILFLNKKQDSPIKIIDFGMAKVLPRLRALTELCGTPYYTAPEILEGHYAHGADMWSVGVIMFVMLFGFPPFYVDPNKYYGKHEAQAIYALIQKGFNPVVKKGYGAWFPKKIPVSESARDLMAKLLQTDRAKRITAREFMQHPWIKNEGAEVDQKAADSTDSVSADIVEEFSRFTKNCNFKMAVIRLFRDQFEKMRPHHFNELKNLFAKLDTNNDGKLSFEEFKTGMTQLADVKLTEEQVKNMFEQLRVDDTQQEIAFEDLLNAAVHDYLVASDERLYYAFRELDKDDDGIIKTEELKEMLKTADPYTKDRYNDILKVIDASGLDNDGKINYEDFLRVLHPNFSETPDWFSGDQQQQQQQPNNQNQNQNNAASNADEQKSAN